jgi:tRNA pseudouridine55 synthase
VSRRRAKGRDVHGILLLDKPAGLSSNYALQRVKRLFNANKAGHTGSLDPIATGLLPICLGEATKVSAYLLDADKGYRVTVRLGQKTSTGDREGEVTESRPVPSLSEAHVKEELAGFIGEIEQIPPMYSALKRDGQPLYKLARRGIEVERRPRRITIHSITLLELRPEELVLEVICSKGTYIRSLAEDIGARLGCGAHVSALRRILTGGFSLERAVTLEQLAQMRADDVPPEVLDKLLLPLDSALLDWPAVTLNKEMSRYLRQGQAVLVPRAPTAGLLRVYGPGEKFLGIGRILDDGRVAPKRLICP